MEVSASEEALQLVGPHTFTHFSVIILRKHECCSHTQIKSSRRCCCNNPACMRPLFSTVMQICQHNRALDMIHGQRGGRDQHSQARH